MFEKRGKSTLGSPSLCNNKTGSLIQNLKIVTVSFAVIFVLGILIFLSSSTEYFEYRSNLNKQPAFATDADTVIINQKGSDITTQGLRITNNYDEELVVSASLKNLDEYLKTDKEKITIAKSGAHIITPTVVADKATPPGSYVGRLHIQGEHTKKDIPVVFNVESPSSAFNVFLRSLALSENLEHGSEFNVEIKLENQEAQEAENVEIEYTVKNDQGKKVFEESKNVVVRTQTSLIQTIPIENNMKTGAYVFTAKATNSDESSTKSIIFNVIPEGFEAAKGLPFSDYCATNSLCTGVSLSGILLLIAIVAYLLVMLKNKKDEEHHDDQKETDHTYQEPDDQEYKGETLSIKKKVLGLGSKIKDKVQQKITEHKERKQQNKQDIPIPSAHDHEGDDEFIAELEDLKTQFEKKTKEDDIVSHDIEEKAKEKNLDKLMKQTNKQTAQPMAIKQAPVKKQKPVTLDEKIQATQEKIQELKTKRTQLTKEKTSHKSASKAKTTIPTLTKQKQQLTSKYKKDMQQITKEEQLYKKDAAKRQTQFNREIAKKEKQYLKQFKTKKQVAQKVRQDKKKFKDQETKRKAALVAKKKKLTDSYKTKNNVISTKISNIKTGATNAKQRAPKLQTQLTKVKSQILKAQQQLKKLKAQKKKQNKEQEKKINAKIEEIKKQDQQENATQNDKEVTITTHITEHHDAHHPEGDTYEVEEIIEYTGTDESFDEDHDIIPFIHTEVLKKRSNPYRKCYKQIHSAHAAIHDGKHKHAAKKYLKARELYVELEYHEKKELYDHLTKLHQLLEQIMK